MQADGELLTGRSAQRTGFLLGQTPLACNRSVDKEAQRGGR